MLLLAKYSNQMIQIGATTLKLVLQKKKKNQNQYQYHTLMFCFIILPGVYEDLVKAGIIDPTKVNLCFFVCK